MGLLVQGRWVDQWYDTDGNGGRFIRQDSRFRRSIAAGSALPPESGRYHLFVSLACPWAHRTLIFRALKGLTEHITVSVVDPLMLENGWVFTQPDSETGADYMYQVYLKADPHYEGRVTVPVLWDKETNSIVNNESSEILRIFNSSFNSLTGNSLDFYPDALQQEIDAVNERVYHDINNGVYKAGFATEQAVYEEEYHRVFDALDWLEQRLSDRDYLVGDQLTEADWRLFTTLIRFDSVYHGHFKLNRNKISEMPVLSGYVARLAAHPGVAETINQDHIKRHYYGSHSSINPTAVVPLGPA